MNWIAIKDKQPPAYNWIILGLWIEDEEEMVWQMGSMTPDGTLSFWGDTDGGAFCFDSVHPFDAKEATHWLQIPQL
jgi:hypothetical protein